MAVERLAKIGHVEEAHEPLLKEEHGPPQEVVHPLPLRWITTTWIMGRSFYDSAKFGIVQYVSRALCYIIYFYAIS